MSEYVPRPELFARHFAKHLEQTALSSETSETVPPKKQPETKYFQPAVMDRAAKEVATMMHSDEWGSATPRHFVVLYAMLHGRVYGFAPTTTSQDRVRGALLAGLLMKKQFGADPTRMVRFVRWVWEREAWREKKRRDGGETDGFRLGLRFQFSPGLVDDYRAASMRARGRSRGSEGG